MKNPRFGKTPKTQPAASGGPPAPPKKTARALEDDAPGEPHIDIPDPVVLTDLAAALRQKPFRIVADVLELGRMTFGKDPVDFDTASKVAWKYGFYTRRVS